MSKPQAVESPSELGARFRRELRELVDGGEITSAFAKRVADDLFEPDEPGKLPALKWSVWCAYVQEQQDLASLFSIGR